MFAFHSNTISRNSASKAYCALLIIIMRDNEKCVLVYNADYIGKIDFNPIKLSFLFAFARMVRTVKIYQYSKQKKFRMGFFV